MPETVFRIAFYAFPLIGVHVALRASHGRQRLAAFGVVALVVPAVCLLLCGALLAASWWAPPQVAEAEVGRFGLSWLQCTSGLAVLAGLGVGAVRLTERRGRA
jgi:hypothetical protein